jgi:hypothetical protein
MKIFWSWQSDTPGKTGRHFVRDAIAAAIKALRQSEDIIEPSERDIVDELHLDQDRQGLPGSPDLARAILSKIDTATVVVADVTVVCKAKGTKAANGSRIKGRRFINPNVGIELGYALRALGDSKTLLVMNTHYGSSDDLPFDLRHKGVSLLYNLPPDADKAAIGAERTRLISKLIPALKHYVAEVAKQAPVTFERWPAKRPPVFFFDRTEVLAKVGVPNKDEIGFGIAAERAISLRLIPSKPRLKPLSTRELSEKVTSQLGAFWLRAFGGLAALNEYGGIVYEPYGHGQQFNEMKALTQVFRTGELWGVNSFLLRDRPEANAGLFLPALVFEKTCFDTLHRYVKFAHEQLGLQPPFEVVGAITGLKNAYLWFEHYDGWGPFHQNAMACATTLRAVEETSVSAALLELFEAVYDETPFARPKHLFGFPPGPPSESAPVQYR